MKEIDYEKMMKDNDRDFRIYIALIVSIGLIGMLVPLIWN